jgi:hypothetical protein
VGLLKRLRGTPIVRHDAEWDMRYNPHPPYEILQTRLIDFAAMQKLRRFARYWDLVGNSGNFVETTPLLWAGGESPFRAFAHFSEWLHAQVGRTDSIALERLAGLMFRFAVDELRRDRELVAESLARDWQRAGRCDPPECIRGHGPAKHVPARARGRGAPKRQARHLGGTGAKPGT